jgi:DnaJ-class molecular chaperone
MAMAFKKIENMDYYEILNWSKNASQEEIERAYYLGKATYSQDSLALYSLLSEKERWFMLKKIEEAYQNLNDPEKRRLYNLEILQRRTERGDRVYFRKSTQRLEIEDAAERRNIWKRIKFRLFSPKRRK